MLRLLQIEPAEYLQPTAPALQLPLPAEEDKSSSGDSSGWTLSQVEARHPLAKIVVSIG